LCLLLVSGFLRLLLVSVNGFLRPLPVGTRRGSVLLPGISGAQLKADKINGVSLALLTHSASSRIRASARH
jgi:hypothetical protein